MSRYIENFPKKKTINKIMMQVIFACCPGIIIIYFFFGKGILIQLFISIVTVVITESLILKIRNKLVWFNLLDGSSILTAFIFSSNISPFNIWWMTVIGASLSICIKQLYGGLGNNLFNPAMLGCVFLLTFFPTQQKDWIPIRKVFSKPPSLKETFFIIFPNFSKKRDLYLIEKVKNFPYKESSFFNFRNFSIKKVDILKKEKFFSFGWQEKTKIIEWAWVNIGFLIGGLYLIYMKIIDWYIPISCIISIFFTSSLGYILFSKVDTLPIIHLFSDMTMLGSFFIATDPVTSPIKNNSKIIFGVLIGILVWTIRTFGKFSNGSVAFSVLLANILVPWIDDCK